ncbi:MAG: tetratricopeptide repeat protein [Acidobacteria bacterium]|nr:tetratricopeptide repeat protein [Acidobacteriota bacterium]
MHGSSETITFSRDIAPIVVDRCGSCHRPGGAAPFSLLTYADVKQRTTQIADVTRRGFMPPWKSEPGYGEFVGQKRLSPAEIALIGRWVAHEAPEGDPSDLPKLPRWPEGWQLGTPDVIVTFPEYTLGPDGTDAFRIFVLPVPIDSTRFVKGLEFRPGNSRVVHHANIRIDPTPTSRSLDEQDPDPGYDGLIAHTAVYPDGHFFGWTPGQLPTLLPKGMAWRLERSADLVVQVHMRPSGKVERVQPTIGLFLASDPPERTPAMLRLGRQNIDIPAGDAAYTIEDSYVLPVDVEVYAVQPHAHYRARDVRGWATLPDGSRKWLIFIKDWDFRWQHVYRPVAPIVLPKGTTLAMRFTYDNSAENPRNPQRPPRRAVWGQRSSDEMGDLWIQVLTRDTRDLAALTRAFRPKVLAEDIVGYEMVIRSDPENAALHDDVAMLYLDLGRADEAVRHFQTSLRLNPQLAAAHYNLATALSVAGRLDEAIREYEEALRINPGYAKAHNNLASVLMSQGELDEAIRHGREALRLNPDNPEAHFTMSRALERQGDIQGAIAHAREALRLKPGWEPARAQVESLRAKLAKSGIRDQGAGTIKPDDLYL